MKRRTPTIICPLITATTAKAEGVVEVVVRRFADSQFEFFRGQTNAPFLPLAWVNGTVYEEGRFARPDGSSTDIAFQQTSLSQGAFLKTGLRGLSIEGGDLQPVETRLERTGFAWLTINFRPEVAQ